MRPIWAICTKSGQKCSRIGQKKYYHLGNEGWTRLTAFNWYKTNPNSTQFIRDFRADEIFTTRWSGCRVKFKSQRAAARHLAITPKCHSRRQSKFLTANSMAKLLGPRSSTAWTGQTGEASTQGVSESVAVAVGSERLARGKRATSLAIQTSRLKKVLMLYIYWAVTSEFVFFIWNEIFDWFCVNMLHCYQPKQRPSLHSIFRSFIGLCE